MPSPKKQHRGRLELSWTNKDDALLSREDGSYEWVPKRDHRVAEVRLLRDAGTVGEVHDDTERAKDNLLIRGDALHTLTALTSLPEFAAEYGGQVKLVYIDPPFNTEQAFEHYDDNLEHSVWLTMMRDRLEQIKKLLSPAGSVWVHLDDAEMAYCKVILDDIFGRESFIGTIVWQKRTSRENRAAIGSSHDYILIYAPLGKEKWRHVRNRLSRGDAKPTNPDNDPRGPWTSVPFSAQGFRKNQMYDITTPTGVVHQPPKGRCWGATEKEFNRLRDEQLIYFTKNGDGRPRVKQFETEAKGLVPSTWWPASDVGDNEEAKKEILALFEDDDPFDTPKPEKLIQRVIAIATNPGEVVLDCFGGSGTTAAVAHKMGRHWITGELSRSTLDTFTAPRLRKVVVNEDPGGITEAAEWEGGGGFRVLDVAPSMYDEDEGLVVLAEDAQGGTLAEQVAAQLGFAYEPEAPFCGTHGRMRLAVIDGHVDEAAVRLLVRALPDGQRLSLAATSLDPEAAELLAKIKPGSAARVVPQDILLAYRTPSAWRAAVTKAVPQDEGAADEGAADEAPKTEPKAPEPVGDTT